MLIFDNFQKFQKPPTNLQRVQNFYPLQLLFVLRKNQFTRKNYFERNLKHRLHESARFSRGMTLKVFKYEKIDASL
jgi:hypothetical protein